MTVLPIAAVAGRVRAGPRCAPARLVCVDGPSGAGKTTLAGRLASAPLLWGVVSAAKDLPGRLEASGWPPTTDDRLGRSSKPNHVG